MKRKIASLMLLILVTTGSVAVSHSAIYDEKRYNACHDKEGRFDPQSKDCDVNSCGCFFHEIEEFFKDLFR